MAKSKMKGKAKKAIKKSVKAAAKKVSAKHLVAKAAKGKKPAAKRASK